MKGAMSLYQKFKRKQWIPIRSAKSKSSFSSASIFYLQPGFRIGDFETKINWLWIKNTSLLYSISICFRNLASISKSILDLIRDSGSNSDSNQFTNTIFLWLVLSVRLQTLSGLHLSRFKNIETCDLVMNFHNVHHAFTNW